jgi:hypothetical protein
LKSHATHTLPDSPYPYQLYKRFIQADDAGCEECVSKTLRIMYDLPIETQAFLVYFIGRASLSSNVNLPQLPMPPSATWKIQTDVVDRAFKPTTHQVPGRRFSMQLFRTMLLWLTVGMLVTQTDAGKHHTTYCFSAQEISYTTDFPSLVDDHPKICATFDAQYGSWLWQHSIETKSVYRKGGSVTRPVLMSDAITALNPDVTCYDNNDSVTEPSTSAWCSVHMQGNSFASQDRMEYAMYIVLAIICCGLLGFTSVARPRQTRRTM